MQPCTANSLEAELKTSLLRTLTLEQYAKLARRGEAWGDSESRQMLEHGICEAIGNLWGNQIYTGNAE
jgi:hypothetical protein